ncbi:hypothetical protein ACU4HD_21900 [Cupriavidus basilensis]
MNKIHLLLVAMVCAGPAQAFDMNDCILQGMKGVSSDVAARQIRYACEQKLKAYKLQRSESLSKEFGSAIDKDDLELAKFYNVEGPELYSLQFTNKNPSKTVRYIRLDVMPLWGQPKLCDWSKSRTYAYEVTVKPGAAVSLIYPSPVTSNCLIPSLVLARPVSWKDVSLPFSIKPADKDPLADDN